ncbi:MAG: aquaporin family protein [Azoarcus sp.]|jgi:glycerol uptake facilitator-like aquaporin|nr:aquaporin family protein [Azoarcus sp.]
MNDIFPLRRLGAEFLATAFLLAAILGSGIMAERLAGGNVAVALLGNTFATIFALYFLIEIFGPMSGAHMNPAVSLLMTWRGELDRKLLCGYLVAQVAGAILGAWLANAMFDLPVWQLAAKARTGMGQWLAEAVATAGLLLVVLKAPAQKVAACVAAYIGAAFWFTSSTSFANPAVTIGRMFSDTFSGIAPQDAPAFIAAQGAGILLAVLFDRMLPRNAGV